MEDLSLSEIIVGNSATDEKLDHQTVGYVIFARVVFHLCHCLLNHPLLLRMRLQRLKAKAPPIFLSRAFETSCKHACKLSAFLNQAEIEGCHVEASFYAYATCVAGSILSLFIHAEQGKGSSLSEELFESSQHTLRILERMGAIWDHASKMVRLVP